MRLENIQLLFARITTVPYVHSTTWIFLANGRELCNGSPITSCSLVMGIYHKL